MPVPPKKAHSSIGRPGSLVVPDQPPPNLPRSSGEESRPHFLFPITGLAGVALVKKPSRQPSLCLRLLISDPGCPGFFFVSLFLIFALFFYCFGGICGKSRCCSPNALILIQRENRITLNWNGRYGGQRWMKKEPGAGFPVS